MIENNRHAWFITLALGLGACSPPAQPKPNAEAAKTSASADAEPEPAAPAPEAGASGWDNLRLEVVGVGRLNQGDQPEQAVLDAHRATVEAALEPMAACLKQSDAAREAKPVKVELRFGSDTEGRTRVSPLVFNLSDADVSMCLRQALGDDVAPAPDERIAVDVAVLIEVSS